MTICIAGKNNISVAIAQYIIDNFRNFKIIAITNNNDTGIDGFQKSFRKFCLENNIPLVRLEYCYDIEDLIFLSLEFDKIIKPSAFKSTKLYNIHFSLLPAYRGMYTSVLPILKNENTAGVTLHKIDWGIDTGDIIAQRKFDLPIIWNSQDLYMKFIFTGIDLIKENLQYLISGEYKSHKQKTAGASYYSKNEIDFSKIKLDLNKCAYEIKNQVRAYTFPAYQIPKIEGKNISNGNILDTRSNVKAGKIIKHLEAKFVISTIDYDMELLFYNNHKLLHNAKNGNLLEIKKLELCGYPLHEKNCYGWDALIVAAYNNQFEVAKWLIENQKISINSTNNNGTSVAMYTMTASSLTGNYELLKYLQNFDVNWFAKDIFGKDIFSYATKTGNQNIIKILG